MRESALDKTLIRFCVCRFRLSRKILSPLILQRPFPNSPETNRNSIPRVLIIDFSSSSILESDINFRSVASRGVKFFRLLVFCIKKTIDLIQMLFYRGFLTIF
mgnify:FL=1